MPECPSCRETSYYVAHIIPVCMGCSENVCTHCFHGLRYCCRAHLPPPPPLTREIGESKWEAAEEHMRENPLLQEHIVYQIPNKHIYKVVRDGMRLLRIHITLGK